MEKCEFKFQDSTLSGTLFAPGTANPAPGILFIHGSMSSQTTYEEIAPLLVEHGFYCMTFDLPGHGESEGDMFSFTTDGFLSSVEAAFDYFAGLPGVDKDSIIVLGSSFGAYQGVRLTASRKVKALILRVPANYLDNNLTGPKMLRGSDNPEVMAWRREPLHWSKNRALTALHNFPGKIFIIESGADDMVPHQTVQNYIDAIKNKEQLTYLLMEGAPHSLKRSPEHKTQFNQEVLKWLRQQA